MTQEQLNGTHVGARFQQMNGEGVPKAVGRDRFGNAAALVGLLAGVLHRLPGDGAVLTPPPGKSHCLGLFTGHQRRRIWSSLGESMT
jgi:hypothetical protein